MDAALRDLLTDTVLHTPVLGKDAYGKPAYGATVARPARVEWVTRRFVNVQGQEAISRAVVFLEWDFTLDVLDKLELSDGTTPVIQRIERISDEVGKPNHLRVMV